MDTNYTDFICPANGSYSLACDNPHDIFRYTEAGASWILICSMIIFFMKAGFLLIELSFASEVPERRNIVLVKNLDVAGTALAFWLFGFTLSHVYENDDPYYYNSLLPMVLVSKCKSIPHILWFFKFGFASNTATLIGGVLIKCKYKLRIFSAFLSAVVVGGIIHSTIARIVWGSGRTAFLSPFKFCNQSDESIDYSYVGFDKYYLLDFAGGGAVHLVGGMAALALTTIISIQIYLDNRNENRRMITEQIVESGSLSINNKIKFIYYMYPKSGGDDNIHYAALGVFIIWFGLLAFNCSTTESLEGPTKNYPVYSNVAGRIAVNMLICASGGCVTATIIASLAQIITNGNAINCNEIANGILTSLVAITSNCPYVDNSSALAIGVIAVLFYHLGVYLEYKLSLFDTGRVVPVHAFGGMWSLLAGAIFVTHRVPYDYLRETYEGVCYCKLRLPFLFFFERLAAQLLGIVIISVFSYVTAIIFYLTMFCIRLDYLLNCCGGIGKRINESFRFEKGGLLAVQSEAKIIQQPEIIQKPEARTIETIVEEHHLKTPLLNLNPGEKRKTRFGENGEKIKNAFSLGTGGILLINQMEGKADDVVSTTLVYNPADIEIRESYRKSEKKLSQIVKDDTNVMVDDDITVQKHL